MSFDTYAALTIITTSLISLVAGIAYTVKKATR